jgi:selenocysteine lyase/cysteine desulfurase
MTARLDLSTYRRYFPALQLEVNGRPAIYFDNPGGTQVAQQVIDAMSRYFHEANANAHGAFLTSRRTDTVIAAAREAMADLLNAAEPAEIVFGPNMTTLTFAFSRAIGKTLQAGDEIVVTVLDHDANVAPWLALEERGVVVRTVDINLDDVTLNVNDPWLEPETCPQPRRPGLRGHFDGSPLPRRTVLRPRARIFRAALISACSW